MKFDPTEKAGVAAIIVSGLLLAYIVYVVVRRFVTRLAKLLARRDGVI